MDILDKYIDRLDTIQSNMEKKAVNKDASIVMDVFELDEVIAEMKINYECEKRG